MTLYELAERSGTSVGSLSQIENGRGNPSFALLKRIAAALHVDPSDFLSPVSPSATAVVRRERRPRGQAVGDGFDVELLTPDLAHDITVSRFVIDVGGERYSAESYAGEACIFLERGRLRLLFNDEDRIDLGPGDSVWFALPTRFRWRNTGKSPVEAISVFCPREL